MYSIVVLPLLEVFNYGIFIRESAHGTNKPRRLLHMKQHNMYCTYNDIISYMLERESSLMESTAFRNVSFKIDTFIHAVLSS